MSAIRNLDQDFIRKINEKALLVYAADVQDEKDARDMEEIGAEGIFTDDPDLLENEWIEISTKKAAIGMLLVP